MHILAGLDKPTSGSVGIAGTEITTLGDNDLTKLRREHIGFVFQFFNLLPMLDAKENILLPLTIAGEKPDDGWFDQVVSEVGLKDRLSHRPSELSGGQQQRVAIARALISRPTVLFADVLVNGDDGFAGAIDCIGVDPIPVTWARRNRETETAIIKAWDDGDVTPEAGQTTTVTLTDLGGAVLHTYSGIAGTSQNVDPADFAGAERRLYRRLVGTRRAGVAAGIAGAGDARRPDGRRHHGHGRRYLSFSG